MTLRPCEEYQLCKREQKSSQQGEVCTVATGTAETGAPDQMPVATAALWFSSFTRLLVPWSSALYKTAADFLGHHSNRSPARSFSSNKGGGPFPRQQAESPWEQLALLPTSPACSTLEEEGAKGISGYRLLLFCFVLSTLATGHELPWGDTCFLEKNTHKLL